MKSYYKNYYTDSTEFWSNFFWIYKMIWRGIVYIVTAKWLTFKKYDEKMNKNKMEWAKLKAKHIADEQKIMKEIQK